MKDILLNENNDLKIIAGDFDIGESEMQEVGLILQSWQGQWKENPLTGANLEQFLKGKTDKIGLEKRIRIQMKLDEKNYDVLKNKINITVNDGQ